MFGYRVEYRQFIIVCIDRETYVLWYELGPPHSVLARPIPEDVLRVPVSHRIRGA
jgi:hypothetical protein